MHLPLEVMDQGLGSLHSKAMTSSAVVVQIPMRLIKTVLNWREARYGKRLYKWIQTELFAKPKVTT